MLRIPIEDKKLQKVIKKEKRWKRFHDELNIKNHIDFGYVNRHLKANFLQLLKLI